MTWLMHVLGVDNATGRPYAFWSGAGSDFGEVALLAGLYGMFRKHNCHQSRCWRIGRHTVDGTPWCNRHHGPARERRLSVASDLSPERREAR